MLKQTLHAKRETLATRPPLEKPPLEKHGRTGTGPLALLLATEVVSKSHTTGLAKAPRPADRTCCLFDEACRSSAIDLGNCTVGRLQAAARASPSASAPGRAQRNDRPCAARAQATKSQEALPPPSWLQGVVVH